MPALDIIFYAVAAVAAVFVLCLGRLLDRSAPPARPQPGLTAAEDERLRRQL